eukprot:scaffold2101_cov98-Isochrysis_galbana.AAC.3
MHCSFGVVEIGGEIARDRAPSGHRVVPPGVGKGAHSSDLEVLTLPREVEGALGWARGGGGEEA